MPNRLSSSENIIKDRKGQIDVHEYLCKRNSDNVGVCMKFKFYLENSDEEAMVSISGRLFVMKFHARIVIIHVSARSEHEMSLREHQNAI